MDRPLFGLQELRLLNAKKQVCYYAILCKYGSEQASMYIWFVFLPVCLPTSLSPCPPGYLSPGLPVCLLVCFFNSPAIAYIETIPSFATWSSLCTRDGMAWAGEITRVCQIPLPTKWTTDWQVPCLSDPTGGGVMCTCTSCTSNPRMF